MVYELYAVWRHKKPYRWSLVLSVSCSFLDLEFSMIPAKQMANSKRRPAMQRCAATCQTLPSLPLNKVGLTKILFAHNMTVGISSEFLCK